MSLHTKTLPRISKSKKGHNSAKKQTRVTESVPIISDIHTEHVCEVSIHSEKQLFKFMGLHCMVDVVTINMYANFH